MSEDQNSSSNATLDDPVMEAHQGFIESLSEEEKMLILNMNDIPKYKRNSERMERDLKDRLRGRPYIFKLVKRIEDDLERLQRMRAYEAKYGVNLADLAKYLKN